MNDPLYAISFWRPWPSLILRTDEGRKDCENRTRPPPKAALGLRIALHAGLKYEIGEWPFEGEPPTDKDCPKGIVGTALLAGYLDTRGDKPTLFGWPSVIATSLFDTDLARRARELDQSPWWCGPVGMLLVEPRTLREPIPLKGQQGWWKLDDVTRARVGALGG